MPIPSRLCLPTPRTIARLLRRFARASEGNIAILFAIALVPLLGFVGAAVDYSRANRARTAMQAALDSTALMVAKDLSAGVITTFQINATAQQYFTALYTDKEAQSISVNATYTQASGGGAGSTVQVNGSASITTDFMKIAGFPNINFNGSSTTTWGSNLLRVALVLDNTGSMADFNKIGALQTAAKSLVTQLSGMAAITATSTSPSCPSRSTSMSAPRMSARAGCGGTSGIPKTIPTRCCPIRPIAATETG